MKIIQSFAQFEEGSPYLQHRKKGDYVYLQFYGFLLSQLTITKHCGLITMFCNQKAYNTFFKYIQYDNIIIKENDNGFYMWSKYKLDCLRTINDDFLHIDSDVFVDRNFFTDFINGKCDVLVQDIVPFKQNSLRHFVITNREYFKDTKILTKPFNGRAVSCGTVGINKMAQEYYFAGIDVFYNDMLKIGLEKISYSTLLLEEQLLYLLAFENDFRINSILSDDDVAKYGILEAGTRIGYLHLWMQLKYKRDIINYIRKKIFFDFPEYYDTVLKYEREVLSKFNFFPYFKLPMIYD